MKFRFITVFLILFSFSTFLAAASGPEKDFRRAVNYYKQGDFRSSEAVFNKIVSGAKKSKYLYRGYGYLGDIYYYTGRYDKALAAYKKAGHYRPLRFTSVFKTGKTLVRMKKYGDGINALRDFLDHKPPQDPLEDHALFWIAKGYDGLNNPERALKTLDILNDLYPKSGIRDDVRDYRALLSRRCFEKEYRYDLNRIFSSARKQKKAEPESPAAVQPEYPLPDAVGPETHAADNTLSPEQEETLTLDTEPAEETAVETPPFSSEAPAEITVSSSSVSPDLEIEDSSLSDYAVIPSASSVSTYYSSMSSLSSSSSSSASSKSSVSSVSLYTPPAPSVTKTAPEPVPVVPEEVSPTVSSPETAPPVQNEKATPEQQTPVKWTFTLTDDFRMQKAIVLVFFNDQLIGDFENIRKEQVYIMKSFLDSGQPDDVLPQMPEDYYRKNSPTTVTADISGKGKLRIIQYSNVRMIRTRATLRGDMESIAALIRSGDLPKYKENRNYPPFAFMFEYNVGLLYEEDIDADQSREMSMSLKPMGLMIGVMGVVWLEKAAP